MLKPHPIRVAAIASEKGGVGKTNVTVNSSLSLASKDKDMTILDAADRDRGMENMVSGTREGREVYDKHAKVPDLFLEVTLDNIGHIPYDENMQKEIVEVFPRSRAVQAFQKVSKKVNNRPLLSTSGGHLEFFVERLIQESTMELLP